MKAIVFIGGGRITSALLAGLRLASFRGPLVVYDHHPLNSRRLRDRYHVKTETRLDRAIAQAQVIVIAVRPTSVSDLLREIGAINRPLLAVSLAAGIPLANLQKRLPAPVRWVRAMPSPASRSGRGLTGLTFAHDFPTSAKRKIRNLFGRVGSVLEIPERKFDAFTVTYSCSHGYHALSALSAAAEELGLDRKTALMAAAHALADGIVAWRNGNISLQALMREAATPGGIAAAVIEATDRAGFTKAVAQSLKAGLSRTRQNSRLV